MGTLRRRARRARWAIHAASIGRDDRSFYAACSPSWPHVPAGRGASVRAIEPACAIGRPWSSYTVSPGNPHGEEPRASPCPKDARSASVSNATSAPRHWEPCDSQRAAWWQAIASTSERARGHWAPLSLPGIPFMRSMSIRGRPGAGVSWPAQAPPGGQRARAGLIARWAREMTDYGYSWHVA
jgi:hypothetical protein